MEMITLLSFCIVLICCVLFNISVLYALFIGLLIFLFYAYKIGYGAKELLIVCTSGIKTAKNILLTFFFIGGLTAAWRASGTLPSIVAYSVMMIRPSIFLLLCFWLNAAVSFLTGTSFGTAATMGVICASIGSALHFPMALCGGAILSGAYFGDRASPVSTSALLVSEISGTDLYKNIHLMFKSARIPLILSSFLYLLIGLLIPHGNEIPNMQEVFSREFTISPIALLPAALVLGFSLFHFPVRPTLFLGIISAAVIGAFIQNMSISEFLCCLMKGYQAKDPELAHMINGGGVVSMIRVTVIVMLSASYSGIFRDTPLLDGVRDKIELLSHHITPFGAACVSAVLTCSIACNQTLGIMLTQQLLKNIVRDKETMALYLENSAVVIAGLIPWSIAGAVPLSIVGAPLSSMFFSYYIILIPLCNFLYAIYQRNIHGNG